MNYPQLHRYPIIALDFECTGLRWWKDSVFSAAVSLPDGQDFYYDFRREPQALEWLRGEAPGINGWVAHHAKFEAHMARETEIALPLDKAHCTMIRAALLDEHLLAYDLDTVGWTEVGAGKEDIWKELAALFGGLPTKKAQIGNLPRAPFELAAKYAKQDSRLCLDVFMSQEKRVIAEDLGRVYQLERDLLPVLVDMEHRGVRVDIPRAEQAVKDLTVEIDKQRVALDALAGFPVNPNPSKSIHTLFKPTQIYHNVWQACDGTRLNVTDAGKPSFDKETLQRMKHPAAAMILSVREMLKTRDTFLLGHVLGHHQNGYVHANFNQTKGENDLGTGTGRLSCNEPALQQIHKRNPVIAAIVRACFVPDEGQDWCCHDWNQMDFRVFAHYVKDPTVLEAYQKNPNYDYHQMVADFTGLPRKPTPGKKGNAKQINLGLVFGMGPGKLAAEMGLPYEIKMSKRSGKEYMWPGPEAEAIFKQYHGAVPGVAKFLKSASEIAEQRGFVRTITGRRIRFPKGHYHKAGGLIFQGTAADSLKRKMKEVHDLLKGTEARLLINVHDELDSSIPKQDTVIHKRITECLETFNKDTTGFEFRVPIRSSCGIAADWWLASKE